MLLDGVEKVMLERGYAALTARNVAEIVGLKHQLVYYYFTNMDELILMAFRRRTAQMMKLTVDALENAQPLSALWQAHSQPVHGALTVEYLALANHSTAIRDETVQFGEELRRVGLDRVADRMRNDNGLGLSPAALTLGLTSLAAMIGMEAALGLLQGHDELTALVNWACGQIEQNAGASE